MAILQELQQLANQLPQGIGPDILNRLNVLPQIVNQAATRGVGRNQTPEQNRRLAEQRIGQALEDFWTTIDVPLDRIRDQIQHLERGLSRARSGLNNWDIAQTEQRIQGLRQAQQIAPRLRSMAGDYAKEVQNQSLAQFRSRQGGEVKSGTGEVSAGATLGPSGPSANRVTQGGQMAQFDIIDSQGRVVGSTQDPTAARSAGFQVRQRNGTDTGNQQQGGNVNPTERILSDLSNGRLTPEQAVQALAAVGFTSTTAQTRVNAVVQGQDPQFPAPGGTQPTATQPGTQTQPPVETQPGAQQPDPAPSAQPTATIMPAFREQAQNIFNQVRNGQMNADEAANLLAPMIADGTPQLAMQLLSNEGLGGSGGLGGSQGGFLGSNIQPQIPSSLGGIFGGESGGIGLSDLARQLTSQSGVAPNMRGFLESRIGQQTLPFALSVAQGGGDIASGVQDPQGFSNFLGQQGFSPIGDTLRSAGNFLQQGGGIGQGQDFLRSLLTGPEGSVGSELFSPVISQLTQGTGRRFLPGLGQTARTATSGALNRFLANDPTQFQTLPDFIGFLDQQGLLG